MAPAFWSGFEKYGSAPASALSRLRQSATKAISHGKTFGKGTLVGAGAVGTAVGLHHLASSPTAQPLQQGY